MDEAESLWIIPFGKFKDKAIEDVPNSYLNWLVEQDWFYKKYPSKEEILYKEIDYRKRFDITIEDEK